MAIYPATAALACTYNKAALLDQLIKLETAVLTFSITVNFSIYPVSIYYNSLLDSP